MGSPGLWFGGEMRSKTSSWRLVQLGNKVLKMPRGTGGGVRGGTVWQGQGWALTCCIWPPWVHLVLGCCSHRGVLGDHPTGDHHLLALQSTSRVLWGKSLLCLMVPWPILEPGTVFLPPSPTGLHLSAASALFPPSLHPEVLLTPPGCCSSTRHPHGACSSSILIPLPPSPMTPVALQQLAVSPALPRGRFAPAFGY